MSCFIFNAHIKVAGVIYRTVKLKRKNYCPLAKLCNRICNSGIELCIGSLCFKLCLIIFNHLQHESISSNEDVLIERETSMQRSKTIGNDDGILFMRHVTTLAGNAVRRKIR